MSGNDHVSIRRDAKNVFAELRFPMRRHIHSKNVKLDKGRQCSPGRNAFPATHLPNLL